MGPSEPAKPQKLMSGTCNTSNVKADWSGGLTGMVVRDYILRARLEVVPFPFVKKSEFFRSLLRHDWSCRRYGIDSQREAIDLADDDAFSGGDGDGGDGVPQLAVHEHFSGRGERGLRDSDFAD